MIFLIRPAMLVELKSTVYDEPMSVGSFFLRLLRNYLVLVGLATHAVALVGVWYALDYYQVTPRQAAMRGLEKSGVEWPWLVALVKPRPKFADHALDGEVRRSHPRILIPELASWSGLGTPVVLSKRAVDFQQLGIKAPRPCGGGLLGRTSCWISTGTDENAEKLLTAVRNSVIQTPSASGAYGNGWELAFAYDYLRLYPRFSDSDKKSMEAKIEKSLADYLVLLDDPNPSLWHGRTNLAAMAWLCAVVLDEGSAARDDMVRRAQAHFLDVIRALEIVEAWPEGYNYWIQSRGFVLALAASAYVNGLESAVQSNRVIEAMRRTGYWHIYATRPDNTIEGLGDEGSRVDLKDETRRVIDLIAQLTQDTLLAAYSAYIGKLHGQTSYYRDYSWGFSLFNDPTLLLTADVPSLENFAGIMPSAELFGRDGMNLSYIHSGWGPDETFISFKAGNVFTHHGHYDAGHFSIFKGAPLAINSSVNGAFSGPNRLNYSIRSVAKNTLLIMRPGEKVKPNRFFPDSVSDGGQRVLIPTGSAIDGVSDWVANLGKGEHYEGGKLLNFERAESYVYISADITDSYNTPDHDEGGRGGKVESVVRQLFYNRLEDRLLVFDQVRAVQADFVKKWILHTVNKPQVDGLQVLKGNTDSGILESKSNTAVINNGEGYLTLNRLYPHEAKLRLVGGSDYQYYVEVDGDDSDLDGVNFSEGAVDKRWFDVGMWRIELQPEQANKYDEFLVVLSPSLNQPRLERVSAINVLDDNAKGAVSEQSATLFVSDSKSRKFPKLGLPDVSLFYVTGLPDLSEIKLTTSSRTLRSISSEAGIAIFDIAALRGEVAQIEW